MIITIQILDLKFTKIEPNFIGLLCQVITTIHLINISFIEDYYIVIIVNLFLMQFIILVNFTSH